MRTKYYRKNDNFAHTGLSNGKSDKLALFQVYFIAPTQVYLILCVFFGVSNMCVSGKACGKKYIHDKNDLNDVFNI